MSKSYKYYTIGGMSNFGELSSRVQNTLEDAVKCAKYLSETCHIASVSIFGWYGEGDCDCDEIGYFGN